MPTPALAALDADRLRRLGGGLGRVAVGGGLGSFRLGHGSARPSEVAEADLSLGLCGLRQDALEGDAVQ